MDNNPAIQVLNLTVGYGEVKILENLTFQVNRGEIFVILGGSGCGKSTLLRHIIGLAKPIGGSILLGGDDITVCADSDFCTVIRKIGVLFQSGALIGSLTVGQNIALPLQEYSALPPEAIHDLVRMKLSLVGLDGFENHLPSEISGGMKKRAGLARAMALNPEILFLDEPSAGLDPITSAEIDDLILKINASAGATIVIVTHELASIFKVAQRVIMLDKRVKGIIAEGDPKILMNDSRDPFVRGFFNRNPEIAKVI